MNDANTRKRQLDELASSLLAIDPADTERRLARFIEALGPMKELRLCVTGGAGSGKTSFTTAVSRAFGVPVYDFDEYIEGGYHPDGPAYLARLEAARQKLWLALPQEGGWLVEHVESCNEDMVKLLKPTHCAIIEPSIEYIRKVAAARSQAADDGPVLAAEREKRALESREYARMQFEKVGGKVLFSKSGTTLKKLG